MQPFKGKGTAMGNVRVISAAAQESAEKYRDAVEAVFREYRISPGRLFEVRDIGHQMLGDVAISVHREGLALHVLRDVQKVSLIREKCRRAGIDPERFDPPLEVA